MKNKQFKSPGTARASQKIEDWFCTPQGRQHKVKLRKGMMKFWAKQKEMQKELEALKLAKNTRA